MKIKNIITGKTYSAEWRTDHAASSYGQAVMVLETGEAVDAVFYQVIQDDEAARPS